MTLKESIEANFTDADGLISPHPCLSTDINASNNGLMYLGEYITLRELSGEYLDRGEKQKIFFDITNKCEVSPGCYNRSPHNNQDYESVDDYYGLCTAAYFIKMWYIGDEILEHGVKHLGCYNNITPGAFRWGSLLWRDPGLFTLMLWSSHRQVWFPLELIVAIIITTTGMFSNRQSGTDLWRLSWLLIQVAKRESWICKQASKIWERRMLKMWGSMSNVYSVYYQGLPGQLHPFTTAMKQLGE